MNTSIQLPPGQRLAAARLHHRWTQLEVADQLGTTPGNVSRWERGITSPGPYFRRKLCELFGSNAQELGLLRDASEDALGSHTQAPASAQPFQRDAPSPSNPSFIDREAFLALLQTLIRLETSLSNFSASGEQGQLNLLEQENGKQGRMAQTDEQWPQAGPNWMLIPNNAGIVVLVVPNNNGCSRSSSL